MSHMRSDSVKIATTKAKVIWQKAISPGSKWHPAQHTACRHLLLYLSGGSKRREVGPGV